MATIKRSRVALFFLGGSVIDERGRRGDQVSTPKEIDPWMSGMSEMDIIADTEGFFISAGTPAPTMSDWSKLAKEIGKHYSSFDGFVVIHDIATMPAAAAALRLMCSNLGKPIILVGSTLRSRRQAGQGRFVQEFGAKAGFVNAVQGAVSDAGEVLVVYGSHVLRAASVRFNAEQTAITGEAVGRIDFGIRLFGEQVKRAKRPFKVFANYDPAVMVADILPGFDAQQFSQVAESAHGLFLSSSEAPALKNFVNSFGNTLAKKIPVAIYTMDAAKHWPASVLVLNDATRSAALVRFMWGLGQTGQAPKLKKLLTLV